MPWVLLPPILPPPPPGAPAASSPRVCAATLTVGEQRGEAEQGGAAAARHPRGHGRDGGGRGPRGQRSPATWSQAGLGRLQLTVEPSCFC
ncbi:hypothetical protein NN561_003181 [Cricetulus griseus]